jgi:dynein heavy chain
LAQFKAKGSKTEDDTAVTQFQLCQSHYIGESFLDAMRGQYDVCQPMVEIAWVESLVCIIDYQMKQQTATKASAEYFRELKKDAEKTADALEKIKYIYDCYFAFAMIWSFGGCIDESKRDFNGYLRASCSKIKFPEGGSVYDYYFDPIDMKWCNWMDKVKAFNPDFEGSFSSLIVGTAETARQKLLLKIGTEAQKGVLYVGTAGTGKTSIVKDYFKDVDPDSILTTQINFNSYTDSMSL